MIVIEAVMQTEVFVNGNNTITIRQTDACEEYLVIVPPGAVNALCVALKQAAKESREA